MFLDFIIRRLWLE